MRTIKPTITFEKQIEILRARKLIIDDEAFALSYLRKNSYYHLNIYFKQLQQHSGFINSSGSEEVEFLPNTRFEDIVRIHENDCRLRNFILQLLQPIEIRIRTAISYHLGNKYGSLVFYNDQYYFLKNRIQGLRDQFNRNIQQDAGNPIIQHHNYHYDGNFPIFAVLELSSFSFLKNYYACLHRVDQNEIGKRFFGLPSFKYLESWQLCLSDLRNICAHHNYLHQRLFDATPIFIDDSVLVNNQRKTLFAYFIVLSYLSESAWLEKILDQIESFNSDHDCLTVKSYGFDVDWKKTLLQDVPHY